MKYTIVNSQVSVTAETDSENLQLLKIIGGVVPQQNTEVARNVPIRIVRRSPQRRRFVRTSQQIIEANKLRGDRLAALALLRKQVGIIPVGQSGFITTETAKASKSFLAYAYKIIPQLHTVPVKVQVHKRWGGYEVSVLLKK